ncbi:hypothetical protein [Mesorhizobium sp.]|uniref:hypothetical protein n=1 Tax=Mesorhizobium sp. TaxID=1871066 RepID=UPI000FE84A02|nr:hypothetical protein [Mesorhizobium sp.]RWJ43123.1 MAG: hypothetical protein EOR31_22505 [Mesorhizobium sp.]
MTDRQKFSDTVTPLVKLIEKPARDDLLEAIALIGEIDIDVVSAEQANKGVPTLRRASRQGVPSLIVNRGKIRSLKEADIMMSLDQLMKLIGTVYESAEKQVASRRAADALLSQLEPTDPSLLKMRIARRRSEEAIGGRRHLT